MTGRRVGQARKRVHQGPPSPPASPTPAVVSVQLSRVAWAVGSASQELTTESASGSPAAIAEPVPAASTTPSTPWAAMAALLATAAAARASSLVRSAQPASARAAFTSVSTLPEPGDGAGGGEEDDEDGADDEGDDDGDDGDDDDDEGFDLDFDGVPARPVEPASVCVPVASPAAVVVPARSGSPVTVPACPPRAADEGAVDRCCRDVEVPATGRPSTPMTTGEAPSAEFDVELSSDTGGREPDSAGTAKATTAINTVAVPTSRSGATRRIRNGDAGRPTGIHRRSAERIRADSGGPAGVWCTGSAPKLSKAGSLLWRD
jgi:hypothetical protein